MKSWSDSVVDAVNNWSQIVGLFALVITLASAWFVYATGREVNRRSSERAEKVANENKKLKDKLDAVETVQRPRTVAPQQKDALIRLLSAAPKGRIITTVIESDLEAVAYQKQIAEALTASGFSVDVQSAMMLSGPSGAQVGLILQIKDANAVPPHAQAILQAFGQAGLEPKPATQPTMDADLLVIVVGAKPPQSK